MPLIEPMPLSESVIQASSGLIMESHAITGGLDKIVCANRYIERYNSLTITKNFASMEYISGINPNVNNILELEPTSFSVEPLGTDSTVFSWYYTFLICPTYPILVLAECF